MSPFSCFKKDEAEVVASSSFCSFSTSTFHLLKRISCHIYTFTVDILNVKVDFCCLHHYIKKGKKFFFNCTTDNSQYHMICFSSWMLGYPLGSRGSFVLQFSILRLEIKVKIRRTRLILCTKEQKN